MLAGSVNKPQALGSISLIPRIAESMFELKIKDFMSVKLRLKSSLRAFFTGSVLSQLDFWFVPPLAQAPPSLVF